MMRQFAVSIQLGMRRIPDISSRAGLGPQLGLHSVRLRERQRSLIRIVCCEMLSFCGPITPLSAADKCWSCSASDAREAQAEVAILKRKLDARGRAGGSPTPGGSPRLGSPATGTSPRLHPAAAGNSSLRCTFSARNVKNSIGSWSGTSQI